MPISSTETTLNKVPQIEMQFRDNKIRVSFPKTERHFSQCAFWMFFFLQPLLTWTTAQTFKNGHQRRVRSLLPCIHGELILTTSQTGNRHKTESRTNAIRLIVKKMPSIPRNYFDSSTLTQLM